MSRNRRVSPEEKLQAVHEYLDGRGGLSVIAQKYGVGHSLFRQWLGKYQSFGESAFMKTGHNASYSIEFKQTVIDAYLSGKGSFKTLAIKYKIPSFETVRRWLLMYNSHKELKTSGTGGRSLMTNGRKTTFEERVEIASYCISHDHNYTEASDKFKVSYQQARNYTIKYETGGVGALHDNSGKRKTEDTLTEVEKLRAELKLQKAKLQRAEMELSFLKKLEEIERRRD